VEILIGESSFLYVWCGNGVPTRLFLPIHSCLPATIFGQKFSSSRKQMLFIDQCSAVSYNLFSTCGIVFLKLRYRDTHKKLNGWEFGHWLTANLMFRAVTWKKYCLIIFNVLVMQ